jgi:hypothetical protein
MDKTGHGLGDCAENPSEPARSLLSRSEIRLFEVRAPELN